MKTNNAIASGLRSFFAAIVGHAIMLFARIVTSVRGDWHGVEPIAQQRVYFANHVSHGDFVLIWTTLPARMRELTRPVAGADYWMTSPLRRFIGAEVFRAVLVERTVQPRAQSNERNSTVNPALELLCNALNDGDSLIIFPEGTRNTTDEQLLPFKSGLYHLATANRSVQFIPVWIDNLHRVLPKGEFIPVPLACTVTYGQPIQHQANESKTDFLKRAEQALLATSKSNTSGSHD